MISLFTDNLSKTGFQIDFEKYDIKDLLSKIETRNQGFYKCIDDASIPEKILNFKNNNNNFEDIVVLGIGGSALGPICLEQSLKKDSKKNLYVLDNIDPDYIASVEQKLNFEKTLFIVITKSGETPETLAQYFYFRKKAEEKDLKISEHFVFVTDPIKGKLRNWAATENIPTFDVPPNVGGRFSVLTNVGLLPASLLDIDIEKLLEGAKEIRDNFLTAENKENFALKLAIIQYELLKAGKTINVIMPYNQRLIRFTDWTKQLIAESVGKRYDNDNKEVFTGITPVNALGATDQHSQTQLYNEGPKDKLIIFIENENFTHDLQIPEIYPQDPDLKYLANLKFSKLLNTEKYGTEEAYTESKVPNITIKIDKLDEETLGELFMLFQAATAILGELLNINAFNQPGVERSKVITRELLAK